MKTPIDRLNEEIRSKERGERIMRNFILMLCAFVFFGNLILVALINSDFIDRLFQSYHFQIGFILFTTALCGSLWFVWKLKR